MAQKFFGSENKKNRGSCFLSSLKFTTEGKFYIANNNLDLGISSSSVLEEYSPEGQYPHGIANPLLNFDPLLKAHNVALKGIVNYKIS